MKKPTALNPGADDLLFFDALARIGPRRKKHPAEPWKLAEAMAELDHCSISGALVASTLSLLYEPMHSNLELSHWLEPHDHLFPVWNVLPWQTGEFPAPKALGALLKQHDVRALSLFPKTNAWDWQARSGRELLDWIGRSGRLVILNRNEFGEYRELDRFLSLWPGLRVLLSGAVWTEQRYVLPLLQNHSNLHLSFEYFQINYGLEDLVARGHEDQLVFGSNTPAMSAGAHRCYVDYADIPLRARRKIASGNLIRLLGGQCPPRLRINRSEDSLMSAARQGKPLPSPVIDMHMHILHEGMNGAGEKYRMSRGGPKGTFALASRLAMGAEAS